MPMKRKTILLCFLIGIAFSAFSQNSLRVTLLSGNEYVKAIDAIGRMTVSDEQLCIYAHDGTVLAKTPISKIQHITFGNKTDNRIPEMNNTQIRIYPNPTQNILFVDGLKENSTIRLFSIDGRLVETHHVSGTQTQLEVNSLRPGTYLLQMGENIVRFIKD